MFIAWYLTLLQLITICREPSRVVFLLSTHMSMTYIMIKKKFKTIFDTLKFITLRNDILN